MKKIISMILVFTLALPAQVFAQEPTPTPTVTEAPERRQLTMPPRLRLTLPEFEYSTLTREDNWTPPAGQSFIVMTPETLATITLEFNSMQDRHNLYLEEQLRYNHELYRLELSTLTIQNSFLNRELGRTNELLIRSQEVRNNDLTPLWIALGFVAGALTTIGIAYAINPAMGGD